MLYLRLLSKYTQTEYQVSPIETSPTTKIEHTNEIRIESTENS